MGISVGCVDSNLKRSNLTLELEHLRIDISNLENFKFRKVIEWGERRNGEKVAFVYWNNLGLGSPLVPFEGQVKNLSSGSLQEYQKSIKKGTFRNEDYRTSRANQQASGGVILQLAKW